MSAFVPVMFRMDGTYLICVSMTRLGSPMIHVEFVPSELLDWAIKDAKSQGSIVQPHVLYGAH